MRAGILRRIRSLEQRLSDDTKQFKKILPEWLIESLAGQGIPCDASGRPDWEVVARLRAEGRLGEDSIPAGTAEGQNPGIDSLTKIPLRFD
jgi:hypothetical protein